jgi:purine-nucleoside phosphorylase
MTEHNDTKQEWEKLQSAAHFLKERIPHPPKVGLVMGSGLSAALGALENETSVPWGEIPHFPQPTVEGHAGELTFGTLGDKPLVVQRGRVHYYEGRSMSEIVFPVRLMKLLGVEILVLTNAAGAINDSFAVGDFVLLTDHINMIPESPLRGPNLEELGPRFPNLNDAYSPRLRALAHEAAREVGLTLREGVYVATPGPMYETPAEIRAYKRLGADLVGMSTVPEVIAARHCGLEVLGLSCVTNYAAGIKPEARPTHEEVLEVTKQRERDLAKLLRALLPRL